MTATCAESRPWPRRRWWGIITLIFSAQLGLIFWLSDRADPGMRAAALAPQIRLAGDHFPELLVLDDPTLFALPHRRGFSGLAWLRAPGLPSRYFEWLESPRWLVAGVPQFDAMRRGLVEIGGLGSTWSFSRPVPEFSRAATAGVTDDPCQSVLRLEGGLAGRRLVTPVVLPPQTPPQTGVDLLANTEIQVVVNFAGDVVFVPTLLVKSGSPAADQEAWRIAGAARFNPLEQPGPLGKPAAGPASGLTWGRLVFQWCTIPMPATNAASGP